MLKLAGFTMGTSGHAHCDDQTLHVEHASDVPEAYAASIHVADGSSLENVKREHVTRAGAMLAVLAAADAVSENIWRVDSLTELAEHRMAGQLAEKERRRTMSPKDWSTTTLNGYIRCKPGGSPEIVTDVRGDGFVITVVGNRYRITSYDWEKSSPYVNGMNDGSIHYNGTQTVTDYVPGKGIVDRDITPIHLGGDVHSIVTVHPADTRLVALTTDGLHKFKASPEEVVAQLMDMWSDPTAGSGTMKKGAMLRLGKSGDDFGIEMCEIIP